MARPEFTTDEKVAEYSAGEKPASLPIDIAIFCWSAGDCTLGKHFTCGQEGGCGL